MIVRTLPRRLQRRERIGLISLLHKKRMSSHRTEKLGAVKRTMENPRAPEPTCSLFVGIDVGAEFHAVAAIDSRGRIVQKPIRFDESQQGYLRLREILRGQIVDIVALEATGHFWRNLFPALVQCGYRVAVL